MRYKRVRISGTFLTSLFVTGITPQVKISNGLPIGAKFAYVIPDVDYGIWMIIEHYSFPELKDGDVIPILDSPICEIA